MTATKIEDTMADGTPEPLPTSPAKETLTLNEETMWSGHPIESNNHNAPRYLAQIREAVLQQKDYRRAKTQAMFAEAFNRRAV